MATGKVSLNLSREEALVLHAWLHRFNTNEGHQFEDQAEQRVLWDLEAMFEAELVEPLDPKYDELLAAARAKVRDAE